MACVGRFNQIHSFKGIWQYAIVTSVKNCSFGWVNVSFVVSFKNSVLHIENENLKLINVHISTETLDSIVELAKFCLAKLKFTKLFSNLCTKVRINLQKRRVGGRGRLFIKQILATGNARKTLSLGNCIIVLINKILFHFHMLAHRSARMNNW